MKKITIRKAPILAVSLFLLMGNSWANNLSELSQTISQQEANIVTLRNNITTLNSAIKESESLQQEQLPNFQASLAPLQAESDALDTSISNREREIEALEIKRSSTTAIATLSSGKILKVNIPAYVQGQVLLKDDQGAERKGPLSMLKAIQFRQVAPLDTFPKKTVRPRAAPRATSRIPVYNGPPLIEFKVLRSKKTRTDDKVAGYVDEKRQNFKYTATIKSKEMQRTHKKLTCTIILIGENIKKQPKYKVLINERESFSLGVGESHIFATKDKEVWYDEKGGGQYGTKYYGYIAVLEDHDGKILEIKRSKLKLEKNWALLKSSAEDENISL